MRSIPARLSPGVDLRRAIEELSKLHLPQGGFVACGIGGLSNPRLRLASADAHTEYAGSFEILTLAGTVSPDGVHLHMSVASASGQVFGGHVVYGNEVRTTVELLLLEPVGWSMRREQDASTGFLELAIEPTNNAGAA